MLIAIVDTSCRSNLISRKTAIEMSTAAYNFVINAKDMGINAEGKNGRVDYVEKASFSMEILKHIDAGPHSGFLCKVYCSLREDSR